MNPQKFIPIARESNAFNTNPSAALKDVILMGNNVMAIIPLSEYQYLPNFFDKEENIQVSSLKKHRTNYKKFIFEYDQVVQIQIIRENIVHKANNKHSICVQYKKEKHIFAISFYIYEKGFDGFISSLENKIGKNLVQYVDNFTIPNIPERKKRFSRTEIIITIAIATGILGYNYVANFDVKNEWYDDILRFSGYGLLFLSVASVIIISLTLVFLNKIIRSIVFSKREREVSGNYLINRTRLKIEFDEEINDLKNRINRDKDLSDIKPFNLTQLGYLLQIFGLFCVSTFYLNSCTNHLTQEQHPDIYYLRLFGFSLLGLVAIYVGYFLKVKIDDFESHSFKDSDKIAVFLRSFQDDGLHTYNRDAISSSVLGLDLPIPLKYIISLKWIDDFLIKNGYKGKPYWLTLEWLWLYYPLALLRYFSSNRMFTAEEQLSGYLRSRLVDVKAIHKPGDLIPSSGAKRVPVKEADWKQRVSELINSINTAVIIIQPNISRWGAIEIDSNNAKHDIRIVNESIEYELAEAFRNRKASEILLSFIHVRDNPQIYESFSYWFENYFLLRVDSKVQLASKLPVKMPDEHFISFDDFGNAYVLRSYYYSPFLWPFKGTSFNFEKTLKAFWSQNYKTQPRSTRMSWQFVMLSGLLWFLLVSKLFLGLTESLYKIYNESPVANQLNKVFNHQRIIGQIDIDSYHSNTNVYLKHGDQITIEANGNINFGFFAGFGGPDGINGYESYNVVSDFKHGSLVGKVGDGEWFFVGKGCSYTVETPGNLILLVNDNDPSNNSGSFSAKYTIDR